MKNLGDIKIPWKDWSIVRSLGQGGFGSVYEIERDIFGSRESAALKVITIPRDRSEVESDYADGYNYESIVRKYEHQLRRIVREYQLMADMKGNSNVVSCQDFAVVEHSGEIGWDVFIRMELLTPLSQELKSGDFPEEKVLKLGKDICRALVLCDSKNIIHRDIKPENILISDQGDFKLGDFGIARTMDHSTNATMTGTERYMAPEVIKREKYGKTVDIYSLGLVLYWLLNKRRMPFLPLDRVPAASEVQRAQTRRISGEPFPEPWEGSQAFRKIVLKACAYRSQDRFASAREMLDALEALDRPEVPDYEETIPFDVPDLFQNQESKPEKPEPEGKPDFSGETPVSAEVCGMLGIYFGITEIYVSVFYKGKCRKVLKMQACAAVSQAGEILVGSRLERYRKCHPETGLYSVLELMREGQWKKNTKIIWRGAEIPVLEMCDRLMQELRKELDKTPYRELTKCVLAMSSFSFLFREYLEGIMERAGFQVVRILSSSAACSISCGWDLKLQGMKRLLICAVTGGTMEFACLNMENSILEILHKETVLHRGGMKPRTEELPACAGQRPGYPWAGGPEKADCYFFAEEGSVIQGENVSRLGEAASAGAAFSGAQLSGHLPAPDSFVLLDVAPVAYGVEIKRASDSQIVRKVEWNIAEQSGVPVKRSFVCDCGRAGEESGYQLVLNVGHTYQSGFSERVDLSVADTEPIMKKAERAEISVELDAGQRLTVSVINTANGEKVIIPVQLETTRKPVPDGRSQVSRLQALKAVWSVIRKFKNEMNQLNAAELQTQVGQGLKKIEKQCDMFLARRNLSYDREPVQDGSSESTVEMLLDFLKIADSLEYGIRMFSSSIERAEILMVSTYRSLVAQMDRYANVRPVEAEGSLFDADVHSALLHEIKPLLENSVVTQELQRGYYFGNLLLRPAAVKVAN